MYSDNVLETRSPKRRSGIKVFDSRIVSILLYGSEIWGYESRNQIEKIHLRFCKFVLCVGQSANSAAVSGECGRPPSYIQYNKRFIKYWLKLFRIPQGSLLQTDLDI